MEMQEMEAEIPNVYVRYSWRRGDIICLFFEN
jgi:hypothetical protein